MHQARVRRKGNLRICFSLTVRFGAEESLSKLDEELQKMKKKIHRYEIQDLQVTTAH
jgi:hypothetical protein